MGKKIKIYNKTKEEKSSKINKNSNDINNEINIDSNNDSKIEEKIKNLEHNIFILEGQNNQLKKINKELKNKLELANQKIKELEEKKENNQIGLIRLKQNKKSPYINPIIQCLLKTKLLFEFFLNEYPKSDIINQSKEEELSYKYYYLIKQINQNKNQGEKIFNINFTLEATDLKQFLTKFLDILHKELKDNNNNSIIKEIFQIRLERKIIPLLETVKLNQKSEICSYVNYIFFDLSKGEYKDLKTLDECFIKYRKNNMPQSSKEIDENKTNYHFKINVSKVLILIFGINELIETKIEIKENFDITNYTLFENEEKDNNFIYNLYGVVSKIKNENYYFALCYDYINKIWYKYDDEKEIKKINYLQKEILDNENAIPLILFYYLEE